MPRPWQSRERRYPAGDGKAGLADATRPGLDRANDDEFSARQALWKRCPISKAAVARQNTRPAALLERRQPVNMGTSSHSGGSVWVNDPSRPGQFFSPHSAYSLPRNDNGNGRRSGTTDANARMTMPTPYPEQINPATFFSRERRRQRMRQFLDSFERVPRRPETEIPFLLPLVKTDDREPTLVSSAEPGR